MVQAIAREPVAVIGTGYVGLVTAAGFAELGNEVWCVDIDAEKIARIERGEIPIYEPGLAESLAANRERLHFSTDLAPALEHARLLFVAVGTPPTYSGDADLSAVHAVVDAMPASEGHALVMKSTVPVGTGESIKRRFVELGKAGFRYVSCPEFLKEGSALADFRAPDRVVVGDDGDWAGEAVVDLYAPLGAPVMRTDIASAEMVKLASNAFLATKISFINEIANVCEETGADVQEVARGMGLDERIGRHFLRAGIGYGGSCLPGDETVLVRQHGRTTLLPFARLWERLASADDRGDGIIWTDDVEVLAWEPGSAAPRFLPVMAATRRRHAGDVIELRTKMGRRVRCTPDHPWFVADGVSDEVEVKLAEQLTTGDWLPLAQGLDDRVDAPALLPTMAAVEAAGLDPSQVMVTPEPSQIDARDARGHAAGVDGFSSHPRGAAARGGDVKQAGTLRLHEAARLDVSLHGATLRTARNGAELPTALACDEHFWRVVGLYLAEGHTTIDAHSTGRIAWSFHPTREQHLVDDVMSFWLRHGVRVRANRSPTAHDVVVQSRLLAQWWTGVLGCGRTSYQQRLPDLVWDQSRERKLALLAGLWEGDGSWSPVNGGPSVILEYGTVSRELADGVQRLLGDLGLVASQRIGRGSKSTQDTYWLRIAGADQVERAIELVPVRDRAGVLASIARQRKRIAPTGYRKHGDGEGPAWLRIAEIRREPYDDWVYSLEVPGAHSFVTSMSLISHNCFPKDVSALKQLAGNTGYHFQLLTAVLEVNELQKRRVIAKLQKHLGSLVGTTVTLLGLAFKADTDDMREASSLVLAARLQAAGANVRAYDPIAEEEARRLMPGVDFSGSALESLEGADAVVLVTEWPEFRALDWSEAARRMSGALVIDGRNFLDPSVIEASGFSYEGIGRRS